MKASSALNQGLVASHTMPHLAEFHLIWIKARS